MWGEITQTLISSKKPLATKIKVAKDVIEVEDLTDDFYVKLPPIETFTSLSTEERLSMFYKIISTGTIIYGNVSSVGYDLLTVNVVSMCEEEQRDFTNMHIQAFCKFDEIPYYYLQQDKISVGDFIRAAIVNIVDKNIYISLFEKNTPNIILNNRKLGKVEEYELPKYYRKKPDSSFIKNLEDSIEFKNRKGIDAVLTLVGLDVHSHETLLADNSLRKGRQPEEVTAESLRDKQDLACALQAVRRAKRYRDRGKLRDALKCVVFALSLHAHCCQAVAEKGRILRAKGKTEEAKKCFEDALKLSPEDKELAREMYEITVEVVEDERESDEPEDVKHKEMPAPSDVKGKRVAENMLSFPSKRKPVDVLSINPGTKVDAEAMSLDEMKKFLEVLKRN